MFSFLLTLLYVCVCTWRCPCVEVRGQLLRVRSHLLPYRSRSSQFCCAVLCTPGWLACELQTALSGSLPHLPVRVLGFQMFITCPAFHMGSFVVSTLTQWATSPAHEDYDCGKEPKLPGVPGKVVHSSNPRTWEGRWEGQGFKSRFGCRVNLRPDWLHETLLF